MTDRANLYVIAAPSGAGKTTLVKALVESVPNITVSISHTTRPKRPNEQHGLNYYFIPKDEFKKLIEQQDFLEYAVIFDHFYGTSKRWVEQTLAQGIDVILEIDWQGHQQIKKLFNEAISIFILPPSLTDLRDRLIKRNQDHPEIIEQRLKDTTTSVSHIHEFDFVVINDDFSQALTDLGSIVHAGRLNGARQIKKHAAMINQFFK